MKKTFQAILAALLLLTSTPISWGAVLAPMPYGKIRFWNAAGTAPLAGGTVCTYLPGTTTPKVTYSDYSGSVANPACVTLDSRGEASIWLNGYYKVVVKDSVGVTQWDRDYVSAAPATSDSVAFTEWTNVSGSPSYLTATSFSIPGDLRTTFEAGRRIKATLGISTLYGTIVSSTYSSATTVTVAMDSGSLSSSLSSVAVGLLSVLNPSYVNPRDTLTIVTASTVTLNATHRAVHCNSASPISVNLPTPSSVATSIFTKSYMIRNINSGACTVAGVIDGITNPSLTQGQATTVYTDGAAWYFDRPAVMGSATFAGPTTFSGVTTLSGTNNLSSATTFTAPAGVAPFSVPSTTTKVTNLHSDFLDNYSAGNSAGQVCVNNGTKCSTANVDETDGFSISSIPGVSTGIATDSNSDVDLTSASDVILANDKAYQQKDSGGTVRNVLTWAASDSVQVGGTTAAKVQLLSDAPDSSTKGLFHYYSSTNHHVVTSNDVTSIHIKALDIGDWDMDTNASLSVAHGLTWNKIIFVDAIIQPDTSAPGYPARYPLQGTDSTATIGWSETNITMTRTGAGFYDNTSFDATSYNRGVFFIVYID